MPVEAAVFEQQGPRWHEEADGHWTGSTFPTRSQYATSSTKAQTSSAVVHGVKGSSDGRGSMPLRRSTSTASISSATVWPLSSLVRMSSLADSKADTTNTQPMSASSGHSSRWERTWLDLGGHVEGQVGIGVVHGLHHPPGVVGPVQEVGVAEGQVAGAHAHELGHVGQDVLHADHPGAPVVDHGDRAVPAPMGAAVAGLDIAGETLLFPDHQPGVAVERRQELSGGQPETLPAEVHHGAPCVR